MRRASLALVCFVALLAVVQQLRAAEPKPPYICFFLVDDLGSRDVGFAGGTEIPTPNIDAIAREGAILEQFYVMPVCTPTRAAFLTGRYPIRYGLQTDVINPPEPYGLPVEERTLAQALKELGYATAIVGKWHLGFHDPKWLPTRRGFDTHYGHYNGAIDYFTHERDGGFDWHRDEQTNRDEGYATTLIADEAVRIVENADASKPLFLYVPFNGVHDPLQAPEDRLAKYAHLTPPGRAKMAAMLDVVDESIGRVREAFAQRGFDQNVVYLFSTDNGGPKPGQVTDNGQFRAGKGTLYEGGVRSCAAISWKDRIPAGGRVQAPMHVVDLYPTLLKIAGGSLEQELPPGERQLPLDGRDVWPCIVEHAASPHEDILINAENHRGALRKDEWKLIVFERADAGRRGRGRANRQAPKGGRQAAPADERTIELYDLAHDVGEKNDVADEHPEIVADLLDRYERYLAESVPALDLAGIEPVPKQKVWGEVSE
ncbi:MAG TPA: arylsulfatase [Pirellulaceae bacterium]|jgi:arylsulfatase A-like enzyme|nr:arylsulfatase [Pirellulaceae bacterium]